MAKYKEAFSYSFGLLSILFRRSFQNNFNTREHGTFQKLQHGAAAGGDVGELFFADAKMFDGVHGVAAADDGFNAF